MDDFVTFLNLISESFSQAVFTSHLTILFFDFIIRLFQIINFIVCAFQLLFHQVFIEIFYYFVEVDSIIYITS